MCARVCVCVCVLLAKCRHPQWYCLPGPDPMEDLLAPGLLTTCLGGIDFALGYWRLNIYIYIYMQMQYVVCRCISKSFVFADVYVM